MFSLSDEVIPAPLRTTLRGIGQVFFQENALTGACFAPGDRVELAADGARRGRRRGDRDGDGPGAEVRRGGADRRDLRLQLRRWSGSPRSSSSGRGRRASRCWCSAASRRRCVTRLMRRYVPFPTYTTPFIVTTWVDLLPGAGHGRCRRSRPGGPLRLGRLRRGRGPRRRPGDVPGEPLDGAAVPRRHRPERLAARDAGCWSARSSGCWWGAITPPRPLGPSTRSGSSIAPCSRTSRSGSTATTRPWRPSPSSCGGGR